MTDPKPNPKRPYYGGGRARTGSLVRGRTGFYSWRHFDEKGERVTEPLGTDVKRKAQAERARRLAGGEAQTDAPGKELFEAAATRANEARKARGVKSTSDEWSRLKRFAFPEIGSMLVTSIKTRHVNAVLDEVQAAGRSKQLCQHVKQAISNVFAMLVREGVIEINPAEAAELPTYRRTLKKARAVLSDAELVQYLKWQHPEPRFRAAVLERQVMSVLARCFGGLRTGDLHGLLWRHVHPPDFAWGFAPRQKKAKPQPIKIDPKLRPILSDWYEQTPERHRGNDDPVFPTRRAGKTGSKAGSVKGKSSHAEALRRDLRRAFGLEVWDAKAETFRPAKRAPTPREAALLDGTEESLPVDFHSFRRAFRQAADAVGIDARLAHELGSWDSNQDSSYLVNPDRMLTIPSEALPKLLPRPPRTKKQVPA